MEKDEEFGFSLEHLLFQERKCRVCGETKDLINEFYLIRKIKETFPLDILMSVKYVQSRE